MTRLFRLENVLALLLVFVRLDGLRVVGPGGLEGAGQVVVPRLPAGERLGRLPLRDAEGIRPGPTFQVVLWAASGLHLLALAGADLWRRRDPDSLLLALWLAGVFVFEAFVNWSTNVSSARVSTFCTVC